MVNVSFDLELKDHIRSAEIDQATLEQIVDMSGIAQSRNRALNINVKWRHESRPGLGGKYNPLTDEVTVYLHSTTTTRKGASVVLGHELSHVSRRKPEIAEAIVITAGTVTLAGCSAGLSAGLEVHDRLDLSAQANFAASSAVGLIAGTAMAGVALAGLTSYKQVFGSRITTPIGERIARSREQKYKKLPEWIHYDSLGSYDTE